MIKGLVEQKLTIGGVVYQYPDNTAIVAKINELVDVVNELQNMQVQVNDHEIRLTALDDPTGLTPADPYAEQRQWIGCLCKFWNFDDDKGDFSILTEIDSKYKTIPFVTYEGHSYANCEPVKPDDDIIYKGE